MKKICICIVAALLIGFVINVLVSGVVSAETKKPKIFFSDNFDSWSDAAKGKWDSNVLSSGSDMSTSKSVALAGKALHCIEGNAYLVKKLEKLPECYIRFYFYLTEELKETMFQLQVSSGERRFMTAITPEETGGLRCFIQGDADWTTQGYQKNGYLSPKIWHSMEIHLPKPAESTLIEWWIDGDASGTKDWVCPDLTDDFKDGSGTWDEINFGILSKDCSAEIYFDEFVISDAYNGPAAVAVKK